MFWKKTKKTIQHERVDNLSTKTNKIYKFKLHSYSEVIYVAKILIDKKEVLINLSEMEKNERRRIIDFLSGIIFLKNGQIKEKEKHNYWFFLK